MKNKILSSALNIMAEVNIPKGKQSAKLETVKVEEISYKPFMEEIIQEIQFTYVPIREKKTRKMIIETNTTG